jgi:pyruvate dehydrogenase E1 component alpha subunit
MAVRDAAKEAVARARSGKGPTLIENKTYRFRGHYEGDPQKYRTEAEIKSWKKNDPIIRFEKELMKQKVLTNKKKNQIWEDIKKELGEAVEFAKESPLPKPEAALDDLFVNP